MSSVHRTPCPQLFSIELWWRDRSGKVRRALRQTLLVLMAATTAVWASGEGQDVTPVSPQQIAERARTIQFLEKAVSACLENRWFVLHDGAVYRCAAERRLPPRALSKEEVSIIMGEQ